MFGGKSNEFLYRQYQYPGKILGFIKFSLGTAYVIKAGFVFSNKFDDFFQV